jgi:predicted lactoylglutathione lyase
MISLGVSDLAHSTGFYEALGFIRSSASNDDVTFFRMKGTALGLFGRESLAADAGIENSEPGFSGVTIAHNLSSEAEVDRAWEHAISRGASAVKRPEKVFWGGYSGYFADPDGHLSELAWNPFMPNDADGFMQL